MAEAAPHYEPYRELAPGAFRWRLGLRPLDPDGWIELDAEHPADIARKLAILDAHHDTAVASIEGTHAAGQEVLDALVAHLRHRWPERFAGLTSDPDGLHPIDAAGRLVQEDLVLLVERDGELVCGAGSVCFPNRWDLRSKIGLPVAAIHDPVPRLNDELGGTIDRVLARLTPERGMWRLGWTVLDTGDPYQPVDGTARPRAADVGPAGHWLRIERETLRRFPRTGSVLFTIRTHLAPLTTPGFSGAALADALDGLPADVARYKGLDATAAAIATWLRDRLPGATV